jgi:hypothetical protein
MPFNKFRKAIVVQLVNFIDCPSCEVTNRGYVLDQHLVPASVGRPRLEREFGFLVFAQIVDVAQTGINETET